MRPTAIQAFRGLGRSEPRRFSSASAASKRSTTTASANIASWHCCSRHSRLCAALADWWRRAILARLADGQLSVTELAKPFDMSLPAISKHLKVLERAGLIARGRDAQWRPCRLDAGPLKDVADWVDHYKKFWEESFDRLDEYLREIQKKEKDNVPKNRNSRRNKR